MAGKSIYNLLVRARRWPLLGPIAYYKLKLFGAEIPRSVEIGEGFDLVHGGFGVVIHPKTKIGRNVKIYPGVTLGRADIHLPIEQSKFRGIEIGDEVILSPGSKVLCKEGVLRVEAGTVLGANAVLLESTSVGEMWAGLPAKKVGKREGWSLS